MSRHFNQLLANQKKNGSKLEASVCSRELSEYWAQLPDWRLITGRPTIHVLYIAIHYHRRSLSPPDLANVITGFSGARMWLLLLPHCLSGVITPSTLPPVWSQSRLNVHNIWANIGCSAAGWLHEGEMVDYRGGENSDCREGSDCRVCMTWSPKRSDLRLSLTTKVSTASGFNAMMIWRHGDMIDIRYGDLESSLTRPWWYDYLMISCI